MKMGSIKKYVKFKMANFIAKIFKSLSKKFRKLFNKKFSQFIIKISQVKYHTIAL